MQPYLIGLTGGIGSGKSTVAAEFSELGAEIVVGDELGRIALENSVELLREVRKRFGDEVFSAAGKLNRSALGKQIFGSAEHVSWLTKLTFPRIYELWKAAVKKSNRDVVVFDAALIFEWGIEAEFDTVVVVIADPDVVVRRAETSGRFARSEITERLSRQTDYQLKAARADVVLQNNSTPDSLRSQVREFWNHEIMPLIQTRRSS